MKPFLSLLLIFLHTLTFARVPAPHPDICQDSFQIARKSGDPFTPILNPDNPGKGAASGAVGALTAEMMAEALPADLSHQDRADGSKLGAAVVALFTKANVDTAIQTAGIALEHNAGLTQMLKSGSRKVLVEQTEWGKAAFKELERISAKVEAQGFGALSRSEQVIYGVCCAVEFGLTTLEVAMEVISPSNMPQLEAMAGESLESGAKYVGNIARDLGTPTVAAQGLEVFLIGAAQGLRGTKGKGKAPSAQKTQQPKIKALPNAKPADHHVFPRQFKGFFEQRGINIDLHTVTVGEATHLKGLHGKGLGSLPGGWNQRWKNFIELNPNASAKDIYQFGGKLMDEYNINNLHIHGYKK